MSEAIVVSRVAPFWVLQLTPSRGGDQSIDNENAFLWVSRYEVAIE